MKIVQDNTTDTTRSLPAYNTVCKIDRDRATSALWKEGKCKMCACQYRSVTRNCASVKKPHITGHLEEFKVNRSFRGVQSNVEKDKYTSRYTIATEENRSLQPVDCEMHGVRYDMVLERGDQAVSDASSGHLRRCSDAATTNQCLSREKDASILSWPTIMGH